MQFQVDTDCILGGLFITLLIINAVFGIAVLIKEYLL